MSEDDKSLHRRIFRCAGDVIADEPPSGRCGKQRFIQLIQLAVA